MACTQSIDKQSDWARCSVFFVVVGFFYNRCIPAGFGKLFKEKKSKLYF